MKKSIKQVPDSPLLAATLNAGDPWVRIWSPVDQALWWPATGLQRAPYEFAVCSGTMDVQWCHGQYDGFMLMAGIDAIRPDDAARQYDMDHYNFFYDGSTWYHSKPNCDFEGRWNDPGYHHRPSDWLIDNNISIILKVPTGWNTY